MIITPFQEKYSKTFYDLNIEWLETFFYVEDYDREVLSHPEKYILQPGGHIFFAVQNENAVGTVALRKHNDTTFELTKMAVLTSYRGQKIGHRLLEHCICFASENNKTLLLYSNTKLENAIHLYRKFGFMEIPLENQSPYKRSNIKMVLSKTFDSHNKTLYL